MLNYKDIEISKTIEDAKREHLNEREDASIKKISTWKPWKKKSTWGKVNSEKVEQKPDTFVESLKFVEKEDLLLKVANVEYSEEGSPELYEDGSASGKVYFNVTFHYIPTDETWVEEWSANCEGTAIGYQYEPEHITADPYWSTPAETDYDYVEWEGVTGDVEWEGNITENSEEANLYYNEHCDEIVSDVEEGMEKALAKHLRESSEKSEAEYALDQVKIAQEKHDLGDCKSTDYHLDNAERSIEYVANNLKEDMKENFDVYEKVAQGAQEALDSYCGTRHYNISPEDFNEIASKITDRVCDKYGEDSEDLLNRLEKDPDLFDKYIRSYLDEYGYMNESLESDAKETLEAFKDLDDNQYRLWLKKRFPDKDYREQVMLKAAFRESAPKFYINGDYVFVGDKKVGKFWRSSWTKIGSKECGLIVMPEYEAYKDTLYTLADKYFTDKKVDYDFGPYVEFENIGYELEESRMKESLYDFDAVRSILGDETLLGEVWAYLSSDEQNGYLESICKNWDIDPVENLVDLQCMYGSTDILDELYQEIPNDDWDWILDRVARYYDLDVEFEESRMREGNPLTNELPEEVDNLLQDLAQMYIEDLSYGDIIHHNYTPAEIKKLKFYAKECEKEMEEGDIESYLDEVVIPSVCRIFGLKDKCELKESEYCDLIYKKTGLKATTIDQAYNDIKQDGPEDYEVHISNKYHVPAEQFVKDYEAGKFNESKLKESETGFDLEGGKYSWYYIPPEVDEHFYNKQEAITTAKKIGAHEVVGNGMWSNRVVWSDKSLKESECKYVPRKYSQYWYGILDAEKDLMIWKDDKHLLLFHSKDEAQKTCDELCKNDKVEVCSDGCLQLKESKIRESKEEPFKEEFFVADKYFVEKERETNPEFKKATDLKLEDLPEKCKFSFGDDAWENYQDWSLYELYKRSGELLKSKVKTFVSEIDNKPLGWVRIITSGHSQIIYGIKFGTFYPLDRNKNSEFLKDLNEYIPTLFEEYSDVSWIGNLDNDFIKHYIKYIKDFEGGITYDGNNEVLFKVGNVDFNNPAWISYNDLIKVNSAEDLKKYMEENNLLIEPESLEEKLKIKHKTFKIQESEEEPTTDELKAKIKKYMSPFFNKEEWEPEDIELWKSIDWKERNFEEYIVEDSTITSDVYLYSEDGLKIKKDVPFCKVIRANEIFPPYYKCMETFPGYVGGMYDGRKHGKYMLMDRFETQEVYDFLGESKMNESFKVEVFDKSGKPIDYQAGFRSPSEARGFIEYNDDKYPAGYTFKITEKNIHCTKLTESKAQEEALKELFKQYVPPTGKADTVGGEIVRAINRIVYRYYNDGDMIGYDYGVETVNSSYGYLLPILRKEYNKDTYQIYEPYKYMDDIKYQKFINLLEAQVYTYLKNNSEAFEQPNTVDSRRDFEYDDYTLEDEEDEYYESKETIDHNNSGYFITRPLHAQKGFKDYPKWHTEFYAGEDKWYTDPTYTKYFKSEDKAKEVLDQLTESKLKEDFWNPSKIFEVFCDEINEPEADLWNKMSPKEREDVLRPEIEKFLNNHGDDLNRFNIDQLMDDLVDNNYHTEARVLRDLLEKRFEESRSFKDWPKEKQDKYLRYLIEAGKKYDKLHELKESYQDNLEGIRDFVDSYCYVYEYDFSEKEKDNLAKHMLGYINEMCDEDFDINNPDNLDDIIRKYLENPEDFRESKMKEAGKGPQEYCVKLTLHSVHGFMDLYTCFDLYQDLHYSSFKEDAMNLPSFDDRETAEEVKHLVSKDYFNKYQDHPIIRVVKVSEEPLDEDLLDDFDGDPIALRDYLFDKEKVTALDKEEMYTLQDLIQKYGEPEEEEETENEPLDSNDPAYKEKLLDRISKQLELGAYKDDFIHDVNNLRALEWYDEVIDGCDHDTARAFRDLIKDQLETEVFDYLENTYNVDYNQRVEDLIEDFGFDKDEAEAWVDKWVPEAENLKEALSKPGLYDKWKKLIDVADPKVLSYEVLDRLMDDDTEKILDDLMKRYQLNESKLKESQEKNLKVDFPIPVSESGRIKANDMKKVLKYLAANKLLRLNRTYFITDSEGNETCWDLMKGNFDDYVFSCEIADDDKDFYNAISFVKSNGKLTDFQIESYKV